MYTLPTIQLTDKPTTQENNNTSKGTTINKTEPGWLLSQFNKYLLQIDYLKVPSRKIFFPQKVVVLVV